MKELEKKRMENIKELCNVLSKIEENEPLDYFDETEEEIYKTSIYLRGIVEDFLESSLNKVKED